MTAGACISDDDAVDYIDGKLDAGALSRIEDHAASCGTCRAQLAALAEARSTPADDGGEAPGPPASTTRYRVGDLLGEGAMGMVYRAFDRQLDREVALKVLRTAEAPDGPRARRLIREARAMARVRDANVLTVHDAGLLDDDPPSVFVAMELVEDAETLGAHLARSSRADVYRVLTAAARGLRAVHAAGLVHRDFKPGNVLIAGDRVLVGDFGLAAPVSEIATTGEAAPPDDVRTRDGTIVGTPAYMAPEQARGERADARADQYALCVTAWEALTGARPGDGEPASAGMPRHLRRVLLRGLAPDPDDRWDDLAPIIAALERAQRPRWRGWLGAAAAVALLLAAVAAVRGGAPATDPCASAADALTWTAAERAALARRFVDPAAFARTEQLLERHVTRWRTERVALCRAGDELPAGRAAATHRCLQRARLAFEELTAVLGGARDVATVAPRAAAQLPAPAQCAHSGELPAMLPTPARLEAMAGIDRDLARASALRATAAYDGAMAATEALIPRASSLGDHGALARVHHLRARLHDARGEHEASVRALAAALAAAERAGDHGLRTELLAALAVARGYHQARPDDAWPWLTAAEGAQVALGEPRGQRSSEVHHARGLVHIGAGDWRAARDAFAAAHADASLDATPLWRANTASSLANVEDELGEPGPARRLLDEAVAILERELGPDHPDVAFALTNRSLVRGSAGELREGLSDALRAVDILRRVHGDDHPRVGDAHINAGTLATNLGEIDTARDHVGRALDIAVARGQSPVLARINLGHIEQQAGNRGAALAHYRAALAAIEPDGPDGTLGRARLLVTIGSLHADGGELAEAAPYLADAIGQLETLAPDSALLGHALIAEGGRLLRLERWQKARSHYQRALPLLADDAPANRAQAQWGLAMSLWRGARDRAAAAAAARESLALYQASQLDVATQIEEVRALLTELDGGS